MPFLKYIKDDGLRGSVEASLVTEFIERNDGKTPAGKQVVIVLHDRAGSPATPRVSSEPFEDLEGRLESLLGIAPPKPTPVPAKPVIPAVEPAKPVTPPVPAPGPAKPIPTPAPAPVKPDPPKPAPPPPTPPLAKAGRPIPADEIDDHALELATRPDPPKDAK